MNRKNKTNILLLVFILSATGCYNNVLRPKEDFNTSLIIFDNQENEYHKLLFHTITLEGRTISGFSLRSQQMESFNLSEENMQQFLEMKQVRSVKSSEIKCVDCHISVGGKLYLEKDS